jgi:hypothetical protein
LEGLKKTTRTPIKIFGVPAEIRTDYLPNANIERYRFNIQFGQGQTVGQLVNNELEKVRDEKSVPKF